MGEVYGIAIHAVIGRVIGLVKVLICSRLRRALILVPGILLWHLDRVAELGVIRHSRTT